MRLPIIAALTVAGLVAASSPLFAQAAVTPGTQGTAPLTPGTGAGPSSKVTGQSESGRGGTGGSGGILSNGTSDGAGSATGGPAGGKPTNGGSGGG